jgi:hypothetical protein
MSKPCQRMMSQAEFEALQETLHTAARLMSREQIIELADTLFDFSRERRERSSWRPTATQ